MNQAKSPTVALTCPSCRGSAQARGVKVSNALVTIQYRCDLCSREWAVVTNDTDTLLRSG